MSISAIYLTFSFNILLFQSSKLLLIQSNEFTIDKLLLLFNIAWLLQLKKIPNNQIKINESSLVDESKTGLDNYTFVSPLLLHFCCPYLGLILNDFSLFKNMLKFEINHLKDELQKLLIRFSTGVKKSCQKIKDVSHLFSLELVRDASCSKLDNREIQVF